MPHATARNVGFAPIPATYSRLPRDDEYFVMRAFSKHSNHCKSGCQSPYTTHLTGRTLCSKGMQRALDVSQYIFNKAGHAFSVIDLASNKRMQIEVPADCAPVRELLKAMEKGMSLYQRSPVISYDDRRRGYESSSSTSPSRSPSTREPHYIRKPVLETAEPPSTYSSTRHQRNAGERQAPVYASTYATQPRYGSRRQPTYYSVGSRGALPVPRKDDEYYYY